MIVGDLLHLPDGGVDDALLLAEAQSGAPEAGQAIQVFLVVLVIDEGAVAPDDDKTAFLLVLQGVGVTMEVIGGVAGGEGVRLWAHGPVIPFARPGAVS